MAPHGLRGVSDLDDLDELQFVTKREYRRGYVALFDGRPRRLTYGKIMDFSGGVLVYRPALGHERLKRMPRVTLRDLLLFAVCAWPATLFVLLFVASMLNLGIRALLQ